MKGSSMQCVTIPRFKIKKINNKKKERANNKQINPISNKFYSLHWVAMYQMHSETSKPNKC
jgi:hypothetical protein